MDPEEQEDEFAEPVLAAHAQVLPEQHIEGDAELAGSTWLDDIESMTAPVPTAEGQARTLGAPGRLMRRAGRTLDEVVRDPLAALLGITGGSGLASLSDRMMSHPAGVSRTTGRSYPALDYDRVHGETEREHAAAAERAPSAYEAGDAAGLLLPLLIPGGAAEQAEVRGGSMLADILGAGGEAAPFGAADAAVRSDATDLPGFARDVGTGAAATGIAGGALGAVPAATRAMRRRAPAAQQAADLARVASAGGGRGTIARSDPRIAEFARLPGGIPGQAARMRRLGLIGPLDSTEGAAERSASVLERILADGPMTATRDRLAREGAEVPLSTITDALEQEARRLEGHAVRSPSATGVRDLADRFTSAHGRLEPEGYRVVERGTLPYSTPEGTRAPSALSELSDLSRTVPWHATTLEADTARDTRHALRDALDDWVESRIGGEELGRYREGRLDYQTARTVAQQARDRAASAAGNRGISLSDVVAMSGAQSPTGAALRFLLNRGSAMFGPTGRATGREALASILGAAPRLETGLGTAATRETPSALREALMQHQADAEDSAPDEEDGFVPDDAEDGFVPDEEDAP